MYIRYRLIAAELRALTIDSNCAPMVDLATADTHTFLRNRCYGEATDDIAEIGRAVANGMLDGGVLPVLKHMPGHGRAITDSHYDLPTVATELEELTDTDFAPFRSLNDLPMGMTAHIRFSAIDEAPATLSKDVMELVRTDIGFDGLIMTDDISMKALEGSTEDICTQALAAGCDVILQCNQPLDAREACATASGTMSDAAQARAEAALAMRKTPDDIDIPDLEAELEALLGGRGNG
jgi:beta-N-acetylhexosaminidase